jgi:alpha-beta hydrolase superfamily lysophospholipase
MCSRPRSASLALVGVVAALAMAGLACTEADSESRAEGHTPGIAGSRATRTTTEAPPTGPPFAVGVTHVTMVDRTRAVAGRGPTPPAPERTLRVTIRYPIAVADTGSEAVDAPARPGRTQLIVFAHGLALTDQTYPAFLHDVAAAGYVVADPEFPLSSSALPGPATSTDVVEQARDLGFVADQVLAPATRPHVLDPVVFDARLGVVGHSDGGVTAVGFAANSCCADPRVGAVVVLAGAIGRFPGSWYTTAAPPTLVVHGDADEVNPVSSSEAVYRAAHPPKLFVVVAGGTHIGAFEDDAHRRAVVTLVTDFLAAQLRADAAAAARLQADADVPGVLTLRGRE